MGGWCTVTRRGLDRKGQTLHGERVLIVEDEPITAADLANEIEAASGFPVGPATSVAEALRFLERERVDAAVLDVRLLDGEVTSVAMELTKRHLPFVILSGVQPPQEIMARNPGVPVFRKPFSVSSPIRSLAEQISHPPRSPGRRRA